MQHQPLGTSSLSISRVVFGAWVTGGWAWGGVDDDASIRAIHHAIDLGITTFDTAPIYGFGHSEAILGRALRGKRQQLVIATKCGLIWDRKQGTPHFTTGWKGETYSIWRNLTAEILVCDCEQSLKRLGIETIDLLQCHWPDPSTPLEETLTALLRLQEQGKIREIGVSNFSGEQLRIAQKSAKIASAQPLYSLLHREIEQELLPTCRELQLGVMVYSPLEHGLLTGAFDPKRPLTKDDVRRRRDWFKPMNLPRALLLIEALRPIAADYQATVGQLALAWLLAQPGVTAVIVGSRSPEQVAINAKAADLILRDETVKTIRRLAETTTLAST